MSECPFCGTPTEEALSSDDCCHGAEAAALRREVGMLRAMLPPEPDEREELPGHMILLLDPHARAGRTGKRLRVKDAKDARMSARHALGASRDDTPTTRDILRAAAELNRLLFDATDGDAILAVRLKGEDKPVSPAFVLSTLNAR